MKTSIFALAAATIMLAGCNIKKADDINKKTDDIVKDSQQRMDELTNSLYRGGQPGKITISGIIVKKDGDKMLVDDRLKVEQVGGKGNRGVSQSLVSDKNKAVLAEEVDLKTLAQATESKSYINFGCENLTAADTEGLEQASNAGLTEGVMSLTAKKIFICGDSKISQIFIGMTTDELILKDATIKVKSPVGNISIRSAKITLEGQNVIETSGVEATISVLDAPSLDFSVSSEISGEGNLKLASTGGNCVAQ